MPVAVPGWAMGFLGKVLLMLYVPLYNPVVDCMGRNTCRSDVPQAACTGDGLPHGRAAQQVVLHLAHDYQKMWRVDCTQLEAWHCKFSAWLFFARALGGAGSNSLSRATRVPFTLALTQLSK